VIALVIVLAVAVLSGVGYGVYALAARTGVPGIPVTHVGATPTATVPANALLNDPLTSDTYGWSSDSSHCFFAQDGYHINNGYYCNSPIGSIADGRVSVTVMQIAGSTHYPYGIIFRLNKPSHYFFGIVSNSYWALFKNVNGSLTRLSDYAYSPAIHGGLNDKNTLSVEFRGQHITCMVNGVTLVEFTDSGASLGAGKVALEAGDNVSAVFTNFLALP
jgi:hypothetical protein